LSWPGRNAELTVGKERHETTAFSIHFQAKHQAREDIRPVSGRAGGGAKIENAGGKGGTRGVGVAKVRGEG